MFVLKGKPKICTPHSSGTGEPRTTKFGIGYLCPDLTPSAKFCYDWFTGAGALKTQSYVDFGFFLFFLFFILFFSHFLATSTAQTAEPILMVNSSNDVFSRKEVPFVGHVTM